MKRALLLMPLVAGLVGLARADSLNVRLIGSCRTWDLAVDVAVNGDYAYVADYTAGLTVVLVADPTHPDTVGRLVTPGRAMGVAVSDSHAYVAVRDSGLLVGSVADPAHPVAVGRLDTPGFALGVAVVGDLAFVADGDSGLRVISVADPANPVEIGSCSTPGQARNVTVSGNYAYVAADTAGLRVVSVTDPSNPTEVGHTSLVGQAQGVAVNGGCAFVACHAGGLRVVSIADPTHPVEVGHVPSVFADGVDTDASLAYVAADKGGLRVYTIADPAHPTEVGYHDIPFASSSVAVAGGYAYVAAPFAGLQILQYYDEALGDLDVDPDSLDVVADTIRLRVPNARGLYADYALGEFILANTSVTYNPDTTDGPSLSPLESLSFSGSLAGQRGTLDSVLIPNLPASLGQGQTVICTLAVYLPTELRSCDYAGTVTITGKDSAGLSVEETLYALVTKLGDIDVDNDSLDVVADTVRLPPSDSAGLVLGRFVLANTSEPYNPDTADGPSLSRVDSLRFTAALAGPGGTLDSILILNLPESLAQGQSAVCTLAVYVPDSLPVGDYAGPIVITGLDSVRYPVAETVHALVTKEAAPEQLGDLDVDGDSLDVVRDTMDLHIQPAGPVYSPYAKARFMLLNTYKFYNPDVEDGPSQSPLHITGYSAYFCSAQDTLDSIFVLNLPTYLDVGQVVECTLAVVLPVGTQLDNYSGIVTIDAYDTLGYQVRDSFFLVVRGPQPREGLDSSRVAPIPFKPNQNPEHDAIHFQGLSLGARVIVYDASGQSVWSANESGDGHLAWKAEVASGIYVYLVVSADGKSSKVGKLSVIR